MAGWLRKSDAWIVGGLLAVAAIVRGPALAEEALARFAPAPAAAVTPAPAEAPAAQVPAPAPSTPAVPAVASSAAAVPGAAPVVNRPSVAFGGCSRRGCGH